VTDALAGRVGNRHLRLRRINDYVDGPAVLLVLGPGLHAVASDEEAVGSGHDDGFVVARQLDLLTGADPLLDRCA
jgi:hypothetical protein